MTRRSWTLVLLAALAGVSMAKGGSWWDRLHYGPHYGSGFSPLIGTRVTRILQRRAFPPHPVPAIMTADPPQAVAPASTPTPAETPGPLPGVDPPPPPSR